MALLDPFNRCQVHGLTREDRVRLLAEVFEALLEGREPSRAAALFVGGAGLDWLREGGDLLRDHWRVKAPAGSHHTPPYLWQQSSSRGAQACDEPDTIAAMSNEGENL